MDLAAGTGKLTRMLGPSTIGVEPSADMRSVFRREVAGRPVVGGSAEALPLVEHCCDLVTVAQAFHWFDPATALAEMARVLRPGGALALIWNERDESRPWVAELGRIMHAGHPPHPRAREYLPVVDRLALFTVMRHRRIPYTQWTDRSGLVDMVASRSYGNVLSVPDKAELLGQVTALVADLPEPVAMPYVTEVLLARTPPVGGSDRTGEDLDWFD